MAASRQPCIVERMKLRLLSCLLLVAVLTGRAAEDFWTRLTPEERAAAGLDGLTPEQRVALERLAARHADEAVARARTGAEATVRQAREQARAEVRAELREQKLASAGLDVRDDDEPIRTRIAGEFRGWNGRTVFRLANGQTWQQTDGEVRAFSRRQEPEVVLTPTKLTGWKLTLADGGLWIRVKRIR